MHDDGMKKLSRFIDTAGASFDPFCEYIYTQTNTSIKGTAMGRECRPQSKRIKPVVARIRTHARLATF